MSQVENIRAKFEQALVETLEGRPVTSKDGTVIVEDGKVVRDPPSAADLAVIRAYLKDTEKPKDDKSLPKTGEAQGVLADYMRRNKGKLPFAPSPDTPQ